MKKGKHKNEEKRVSAAAEDNQAVKAERKWIARPGTAEDLKSNEAIFILGMKPPEKDWKGKADAEGQSPGRGPDTSAPGPEYGGQSDADMSRFLCARGDRRIADGDYSGAVEDLTEAIRLNPGGCDGYSLRGVAYYELGRYEEAFADDCVAVDMEPSPASLFNRAEAYYKTGRDDEALEDAERARAQAEVDPRYQFLIPEIDYLAGHVRDKSLKREDYYQPPSGWEKEESGEEPTSEEYDDTGPEAVRFTYASMHVDWEWSVETPRGFAWWGHGLAQRVWAGEFRRDRGVDVTLMHLETDFLRNVRYDEKTMEGLNRLNADTAQFAFVYNPDDRRVRLHTTVYVHRQNLEWSKRLFTGAAGLQVSYAHMKAGEASRLFDGSEPDTSPHPEGGFREKPDDMLNAINLGFIPEGDLAEPIEGNEFAFAADCLMPESLTTWDNQGLTSEFPFLGDEPVHVRLTRGLGPVTGLFQATSAKEHPLLGKGLLTTMQLPLSHPRDELLRMADVLNLLESREWTGCHMNGAWRIDEQDCLSFVSFLPIMSYRKQILANLAFSNRNRCRWAAMLLAADSNDKQRPKADAHGAGKDET